MTLLLPLTVLSIFAAGALWLVTAWSPRRAVRVLAWAGFSAAILGLIAGVVAALRDAPPLFT